MKPIEISNEVLKIPRYHVMLVLWFMHADEFTGMPKSFLVQRHGLHVVEERARGRSGSVVDAGTLRNTFAATRFKTAVYLSLQCILSLVPWST